MNLMSHDVPTVDAEGDEDALGPHERTDRAACEDRFQMKRHSREWAWVISADAPSRPKAPASSPGMFLPRPRPIASTTSSILPSPEWAFPAGLSVHGLARPPQHHEA